MEIPVVFIHKGYQDYLNYTVLQSCKRNNTILIGTDDNIKNDHLTFYDINNYKTSDYDKFCNIYEHKSTNPYDYELFCFLRWFILKDFMERHNLETVFYVDSDVMLFVNVSDEWSKYDQYDITLLHRSAAISSFFTKNGLNNFCNFLIDTYSNKNSYNYKKISSHFDVRQQFGLPGGVCDMTYLDFFHYWDEGGGPGKVGEMMQIINNSTYDHNINVPDQYFAYKNGIKDFKIIDGLFPYVYNEKLKRDIKFNSLHLQGSSKNLIHNIWQQLL